MAIKIQIDQNERVVLVTRNHKKPKIAFAYSRGDLIKRPSKHKIIHVHGGRHTEYDFKHGTTRNLD